MGHAVVAGPEAWVRAQVRQIQAVAERDVVLVSQHHNLDVAILGRERARRSGGGLHLAFFQVGRHHAHDLEIGRRRHQRGVNKPAFGLVPLGVERGGDRLETVERRRHVHDDRVCPVRNAVLALVLHHEAAECLQHRIHGGFAGEWPLLAETGNREVE